MLPVVLMLLGQSLGHPAYIEGTAEYDIRPRAFRSAGRLGRWAASSGALFEFAPASGAGMGTACACAAVTGSKGETLTFWRTSVGSCVKGSTTALAVGDMVICAAEQPRVMPGGGGTGGLGLLVETSATNVVTRSEALDNAAFADYTAGGAAAPTVTADVASAPTGADTADMLTLPSTGFSEDSGRSIAVLTAAAYSAQVYVRGATGPGDIDLCVEQTVGATCSTCEYAASSWSLCTVQNVTSIAGGRVLVGHLSTLSGVEHLVAKNVYVWGLGAELGAVASSYVPTAGSAVARASDAAYVDLGTSFFPTPGSASAAMTIVTAEPSRVYTGALAVTVSSPLDTSGTGALWMYSGALAGYLRCYYGGTATGFVATAAGTSRGWCSAVAGTSLNGQFAGTAMSSAGAPTVNGVLRYLTIGQSAIGGIWPGVYKQICVDPDPTRCR